MIHKFSDKFKIIAAVLAVVVVAGAAVAGVALSTNANGVQSPLQSGQNDGSNAPADIGVTIKSDTNVEWSTDANNPGELSTYEYSLLDSMAIPVYSTVEGDGFEQIKSVSGKTFVDGREITYGLDFYDKTIIFEQAGIYTAVVTVNGEDVTFYAQINKKQIKAEAFCDNLTYTGDVKLLDVLSESTDVALEEVLNFDESSLYVEHRYAGEANSSGIKVERDENFRTDNLRFDIVESGTYTVHLEITEEAFDNYAWDNSDDRFSTIEIVIEPTLIQGKTLIDGSESTGSVVMLQGMTVNELTEKLAYSGLEGKYAISYELYDDQNFNTLTTELEIGKRVYAKATLNPNGDGDLSYRNYRMPTAEDVGSDFSKINISFVLKGAPLPTVDVFNDYYEHHSAEIGYPSDKGEKVTMSGTNISATYLGFDYKLSQWFYSSINGGDLWNLPIEEKGHAQGQYWIVTIDKDGNRIFSGTIDPANEPIMRNAGQYTINIKPIAGYSFDKEGVTEYNFTFTISPFTIKPAHVDFNTSVKHTYSGNPVSFDEFNDYGFVGLFGDDISLEFVRADGDDSATIDAGEYSYKADGITSKDGSHVNYRLSDSEADVIETKLTIYKKELPAYSGTAIVSGKFNGMLQRENVLNALTALEVSLTDINEKGLLYSCINIAAGTDISISYPWSAGASSVSDAFITGDEEGLYFNFTHAGSYSVIFQIPSGSQLAKNYCWPGGNDTPNSASGNYTWDNFANIERAEIDPTFNTVISLDDPYVDLRERFNGLVNGGTTPVYTLIYGKKSELNTSADPLDKDGDGNYIEGEDYYVQLDILDDFYPSVYFKEGVGEISNGGKRVKVDYSVSSNMISVRCNVTPYTFGDNFASGFGYGNVFNVSLSNESIASITDVDYKFYTDEQHTQNAVLYNGLLPRNAGTYYAVVTVTYTVDGEEQPVVKELTPTLTVSPREVNLSWTLSGSSATYTYDGNPHSVSVSAVTPGSLPGVNADLVLTSKLGDVTVTNADVYTFTVNGLAGDEKDNYVIASGANRSFTVTVNRAEITVTASGVDGLTFGESFVMPNPAYTVAANDVSDLFNSQLGGNLSAAVYSVVNGTITAVDLAALNNKLSRGSYVLVPVFAGKDVPNSLTDNAYQVTLDNYVVTMQTSSFNVTSQTINVTFTDGQSGVYGESIDLWALVSKVMAGSTEMTVEDLKNLANITATFGSVVITATKDGTTVTNSGSVVTYASVGEYTLNVVGNSGDFEVKTANGAKYTVVPRNATVRAKEYLSHTYGNMNSGLQESDKYDIEGLMEGDSLSVSCYVYSISNGSWFNQDNKSKTVGYYYHYPRINGKEIALSQCTQTEDGQYYYVTQSGNYSVTVYTARYGIIPREITLTFKTDIVTTYGVEIDLWTQKNVSKNDLLSKYDYFEASHLRPNPADAIIDVIDVCLVDADGREYVVGTDKIGARTYRFKAKIKTDGIGPNYVIKDGANDGKEFVGGTFTVNPAKITIAAVANTTSVIFGNALPANGIDFTVEGLVNGDDKNSIGITVGIYDGENLISNVNEYKVGNYVVKADVTKLSSDYYVESNGLTNANFEITPRSATVTPDKVTGHVYGNAFVGSLTAKSSNFVSDAHFNALGIVAKVYDKAGNPVNNEDISTLSVGSYRIKLNVTNANANYNITLNDSEPSFTVVARQITITATPVTDHIYGTALGDKLTKEGAFSVNSSNGEGDAIVSDADKASLAIKLQVYDKDGNPVADADVATLAVGRHSIHVLYTANSNYDVTVDNDDHPALFEVVELTITIKFKSGASSVYGEELNLDAAYEVSGTVLEGDVVTATATKKGSSGIVASRTAPVGEYVVTVIKPNENYKVIYADENVTTGVYNITPRAITITANAVNNVYGDSIESKLSDVSAYTVTNTVASYTGSALVGTDNLDIKLVVVNGSDVADKDIPTLDGGNYNLKVTYDENKASNYTVTVVETAKFTVTQRELTWTFTLTGGSSVYGQPVNLYHQSIGTLTNNVNGKDVNDLLILTLTDAHGSSVTGTPSVDNYGVTAELNVGFANNYSLKVVGVGKYSVTQSSLVLEVSTNFDSVTYGNAFIDNPFGFKAVEGTSFVGNDEQIITVEYVVRNAIGNLVTDVSKQNVGTYTVGLNVTNGGNYAIKVNPTTFDIVSRQVTVTFNAGSASVYGETVNLYNSSVVDIDIAQQCLVNGHTFEQIIKLVATKDGKTMAADKPSVGIYVVSAEINTENDFANNYVINPVAPTTGKYEITQRNVTITATNVNHIYGDVLSENELQHRVAMTDGSDKMPIIAGDDLKIELSVRLTLDTASEATVNTLGVDEYVIKVDYDESNANYNVKVVHGKFIVTPRPIKIAFVDGNSDYGTAITESDLDALHQIVEGRLVNRDKLVVTAMQGTHSLTENNAPAGTYVVTVKDDSGNYTVSYRDGASGSYVVNKKVITVSLKQASVQYREDGSDYHNGEYGATLNAEIMLNEVVEGDSLTLGNGYSVAYALKGTSAAPNKAGKYTVTVTITNSNYTFANGQTLTNESTLDYEITKKVFDASDLVWNETMKVLEGSDAITTLYVNYIPNYIDAIMEIVPYDESTEGVYKLTAGNTKPVSMSNNGDRDTANSYFFENGMLYITAQGRARYVARFKLTEAASANYVIDGANEDGIVEAICFIVDKNVEVKITTQNWQYGDEAIDPVVTVNGQNPIYGLTYQYARLTANETEIAKLLAEKEQNGTNGFELSRFDGLYGELSYDKPSFDVGYYLICVTYDGMKGSQDSEGKENIEIVTITICDFIEVSKKQLRIPLTINSAMFNGDYQWGDVDFNMPLDDGSVMNIREFVTTSVEGDNLREMNVGTYTIELFIKPSYANRYTWADDMLTDGKAIVTWEIVIDDSNNDDNRYFEVDSIDQVTYGQDVVKKDPTLKNGIKAGYGKAFTWYFASKGEFTNAADIPEWTEWTAASKPQQSGEYFAKVVLSDVANGGKNFTDKIAYGEFYIDKATLTLTLSGTIVYGNKATQGDCSYVASGFEYGEDKSAEPIIKSVGDGIYYYLVDESDDRITDVSKLAVDTYNLTARLDGKYVRGLEADNYYIVLANDYGKFEVTAKKIHVVIGNANGQFGTEPDLKNNVEITYVADKDGIKTDEQIVIDGVRDALKISGTILEGCKTYTIYADYNTAQNKNFVIEYTEGVYTVTKRQVNVTLNSGSGTYDKAETFAPVTIASVLDSGNNAFDNVQNNGASYVITIGSSVYTITVVYNGTSNGGKTYVNSEAYPAFAGGYTATVTGSGSDNFEIVGTVTAKFDVSKFTVDVSKISVQPKVYDGKAPESLNIVIDNADFTQSLFAITGDYSGFVNVNDETGYDVEIKLNDFNNYEWSNSPNAFTTVKYFVLPAGIYATPGGKIVYGTAFEQSTVNWTFVYAEGGAAVPDDVVREIAIGAVEFKFDKDINRSRPAAGNYKITCEVDASGRIVGMTHANYNITLQPNDADKYGDYVVDKKPLTIVAGSSGAVYSQNHADFLSMSFDLDTTIEGNGVFADETLQSVITKYAPKFKTTVNSNTNVGTYYVTADVESDNYAVTVVDGMHEILPIKVKIALEATDGEYHGTTATYGVASLVATNLDGYDFTSFDNGNLAYYFTGIGGTIYASAAFPTNAGRYEVTVTAINNVNGNFVIDSDVPVVTATFEIAKMIIDETEIVIASKSYNGYEQSHGLQDGDGYTVSTATYKNVGSHPVTLTIGNTDNYAWKYETGSVVTKNFEITKITVQLVPNGTIVYGESFESGKINYRFELIGLVGEDIGKDYGEIVNGNVTYSLMDNRDGTKLDVNAQGYEMIADVSGITADNYDVVTAVGRLIVRKRAVTIRPDVLKSVYGESFVVTDGFTVVSGDIVEGDVIEYSAESSATRASNAGTYDITVTVAYNPNYEITKLTGTHTISKAIVSVDIRAINGIYGDAEHRGGIEFVAVEVVHSDNTTEAIDNLQFVVSYKGTANDGTRYDGNTVPAKAGVYTVTVEQVISNNYELGQGVTKTYLEIAKRQIDASKITVTSASYTGKAIAPKIQDDIYNLDNDNSVYTVSYGQFVNVGEYDVTLSLADTYNNVWMGNLNRDTVVKFKITKADNRLVDENNPNAPADSVKVEISDWTFDGEASSPKATVASGESNVVFEYATSEHGDYTRDVPENAGEYWVRAVVAESANYNAYVSGATRFVISKKVVNLPSVVNLNENSVYTGSMLSLSITGFDDRIMSLTLDKDMYRADDNGQLNLLALNANTYKAVFRLRNENNYVWADSSNLVDGTVVVNWTVGKQIISKLPNATSKILVNGDDIVFIPEGFNSGIMTIESNVHAHEGHYTAVVTLKDTGNYAWEGTDSASIAVEFEITGTNTVFVAIICVVAGLSVGLAVMAIILTLVNRRKKRKQAEDIDARSRADGWEGE